MPSISELTEKRNKAVEQARSVMTAAKEAGRDMNAEERKKCDDWMSEAEGYDGQIEQLQGDEQRSSRLARLEEEGTRSVGRQTTPTEPENRSRGTGRDEPREVRWNNRYNPEVERVVALAGQRAAEPYRKAYRSYLQFGRGEMAAADLRALQSDNDTEGGYLNAPTQMVAELLKGRDNAVPFRGLARLFMVNGRPDLGVPTLDTDQDDPTWTSELGTGSEDTAMRIGQRKLEPKPLAKRIKLSRKLMRTSAMDAEALVRERLVYKFGVAEENAYLTGSGVNQPLGIFTAHTDGIPTTRDVSTGNSTDAIGADHLIEVIHTLKPQYWPNARWFLHRLALRQVRLLKDGNGQYLWQPGLQGGQPARILDFPYVLSEYAPSTFTTGKYVACFGDFSFYWIAEALSLEIQVLIEKYAETNQNGYIGRVELDGMPVLAEAFVRSKLA